MSDKLSLFVPGRLCLFGEHSDWAGLQRIFNADIAPGMAIVTGIEQGIYADVEPHDNFVICNASEELRDATVDFECTMSVDELKNVALSGSYYAYVAGVASYICENYRVGGLKITITGMTLPQKSGLSSSAAICVLVARAFNMIYGLNLSTLGEMSMAFKGEQRTQSRCGRLDQACAFGVRPVLMTFDGEDIDARRLVVKEPLYWVFAHLGGEKDTKKILSDLNKCYPFAQSDIDRDVQDALGGKNHEIINEAIDKIAAGDAPGLGALMTRAQELFDRKVAPASPKQLAAPKLHSVLDDKRVKTLTYGGKGVGSQGDGSVQFLAKDESAQVQLVDYLSNELKLTAYPLTLKPQLTVHKAVIPVAGFGTRLYPFTRTLSKSLLPIIDTDGLVKPVLLTIVEQLVSSGIDEICLVVGSREDEEEIKKFFCAPLTKEHFESLPAAMQEYDDKIRDIGKCLTFRIQEEKKGFGHAVLQAMDFCGGEPVVMSMGDTIYRSKTSKSCTTQLTEAFESLQCPIVSIVKTSLEDVVHYGTVSGVWEDKPETVLKVSKFIEKPTVEYAEDNLGTPGKTGAKSYYTVLGQYILTPEVFVQLKTDVEAAIAGGRDCGITETLALFIDKCGLYGIVTDGEVLDTGNVKSYREAVNFGFRDNEFAF